MSFYLDMSLKELQRSSQHNPFEIDLWLTLIHRMARERGAADALEEVFVVEDIFPNSTELQAIKSLCLLSLGNTKEGHELLQQSLRRSPGDALLQRLLQEFLPAFKNLSEDLLLNPHAIRDSVRPSSFESQFLERLESTISLIQTFNENEGDPETLLTPMERHVKNFPNDINAKLDLARLYHKTGHHPRARLFYRKVLKDDPLCASAYFELATIEPDIEEAIHLSETGLELYPMFECGRYNYASLLLKAGMLEEGRIEMLRIPADSSFYILGLEAIANSHSQQGDFQQAIQFQEKVVALSVNNAEAWNCYGHFFAKLGEYEVALKHFDRVIEIDCEHLDGLYNRASMLSQLDRHSEAVLVLKYALTIMPHEQGLLINLVTELGNCAQLAEAIELAESALKQFPQNEKLWQALGGIHEQDDNPAAAIRCAEKALRIDSRNPLTLWYLARSHARLGHRDQSLVALQQCVRLHPELRQEIRNEDAFKIFINDPGFQSLVGQEN